MNTQRLRILLLAQQNNPDWISVPLVGYQHSAALAAIHDVTLVTHFENREAIVKAGDTWKEIYAIDLGIWETFYRWCFWNLFKGDHGSQILTVFRIPFYFAFEAKAWAHYKKALKGGEFDLVVRITPVAPVIPSLFASRCRTAKIPFILGPINGGLPWPVGYQQAEKQKEWVSSLRSFYTFLPFARSTYKDAQALVVGSSETYRDYKQFADKLFFMPENGIRESMVVERAPRDPSLPLKLIFVGRLVPSKACDIALKAAAPLLLSGAATFTVVGDGEERPVLEALAKELNVSVTITGIVPHAQAMAYFRAADVLVFPSIREFGGGVIFEALALGCVPLVSNYGGPGDIVLDGRTGFKIDLKDEEFSIAGFRFALERLAKDRPLLETMAREGQRYVKEELSWRGKALQMTKIFQWCLGREAKPEYAPPRKL